MNINPFHDNILIELIKERKTAFGLIVPETVVDKISKGFVKAVGPGRCNSKDGSFKQTAAKKGDCVIFNKQNSIEFVEDGISYALVSEEDVYGSVV